MRRTHAGSRQGDKLYPTYRAWQAARARCRNPKNSSYQYYGGRGITFCVRWDSFENFLEDMGEKPGNASLDRMDNAKGYEPGNCRWATRVEQNRNTRKNRLITHGGETLSLAEWAERTGISVATILKRIGMGWTVCDTLTRPVRDRPQSREQTHTERTIWHGMHQRCLWPSGALMFASYRERNITICARWQESFDDFLADMGPRPTAGHSIDRIDNDAGYWCGKPECPECGPLGRSPNCRWVTHREQMNNRRNSVHLTCDGVRLSLTEWAERLGVSIPAITIRIRGGMSEQEALSKPFRKRTYNPACSVPGCAERHFCKGFCNRHYQQATRRARVKR